MSWLEITALALLPAFMVLDFLISERSYKSPRFWRLRAFLVSAFTVWFSLQVGLWWAQRMDGVALFNGAALGTAAGATVGVLVYEFGHYWYHRAAHTFDALFRITHQMHHSAESVDAFGAYYLHPLDTVAFTSISVLVFFPLLGLTPEAGAWASLFLAFNAVFQHANIRTPHWMGYLIQRPESHCIHHGRGVHAWNYSDLPLWDMVFGTFNNPRSVEGMRAGFHDGASSRLAAMLFGRDVTGPSPDTNMRDLVSRSGRTV
jgi:sterol desaturase/sphingolipid hydroxylase (fatty acid hydroxylase superfamily)